MEMVNSLEQGFLRGADIWSREDGGFRVDMWEREDTDEPPVETGERSGRIASRVQARKCARAHGATVILEPDLRESA
jgi:hypothetical protein